ncbi:MAG: ribonuclease H-like domain-containing protein [Burkholderiales bacterium]|nr:ribonuclease H-like domain-containing protein [Burkholderiales bacterium]
MRRTRRRSARRAGGETAALLFFDTETTGLAGGTGTLAFLAGLAWFEADGLRTRQYLLTGFADEAALYAQIRETASTRRCLVTYNGKSFDAPLVRSRCRLVHAPDPLADLAHLDLLHATRRRFGRSWPDCRLRTAETRALDFVRVGDLPGSLVPEAFRRFMRHGETAPLPAILEHNRNDLLTLAALLAPLGESAP